jgi:hypothetical protein
VYTYAEIPLVNAASYSLLSHVSAIPSSKSAVGSDVRALQILAANTVVVSINSQPLVRIGIDERPLLVHARLGIAQAVAVAGVVDDVFDVAGAVGRRVARGVGVHELVHEVAVSERMSQLPAKAMAPRKCPYDRAGIL